MNKLELEIKDKLIKLLREDLEQKENYEGRWEYQWVMGISLKRESREDYLARVLVKTSESPYIDGMDIKVKLVEKQAILEDFKIYLLEIGRIRSKMTIQIYLGNIKQLLEWLGEKELDPEDIGTEGTIPRYTIPGVFVTKSVHMTNSLDQLVRDFNKEKNISQRGLFEVALVEFFQKYGYRDEVETLMDQG